MGKRVCDECPYNESCEAPAELKEVVNVISEVFSEGQHIAGTKGPVVAKEFLDAHYDPLRFKVRQIVGDVTDEKFEEIWDSSVSHVMKLLGVPTNPLEVLEKILSSDIPENMGIVRVGVNPETNELDIDSDSPIPDEVREQIIDAASGIVAEEAEKNQKVPPGVTVH